MLLIKVLLEKVLSEKVLPEKVLPEKVPSDEVLVVLSLSLYSHSDGIGTKKGEKKKGEIRKRQGSKHLRFLKGAFVC